MSCDLLNLSKQPVGYFDSTRSEMLRYVPIGAHRTLEFGCGTGGFSALLKDRLQTESWAVEKNEAAAEQAAKKLDKVINVDAMASLERIPDDYFDCVLFFDILEHLVDPYSLLSAMKHKLTPDGVVVASIPNIRYYRALLDFVVHGNWDYREHGILDKTHLRFFTKKSIVKMFDRLEFEILTLDGIHPTSSRTFRLLNFVLFNRLADARYKHFAVVARPK